ncbi:flavin reductase family protein [Streptomyces sp. NPDC048419]|uniref:flavin reductase family protein n=1 Tax=Streptomyces sp. NPDC048419 TaxID=3365547 RepID=UPI0037169672
MTSQSASTSDDAEEANIRPLMASFPTGVAVVTTLGSSAEPCGMTCTSLASVALSPPTLVVCLRTAGPTLRAISASGRLAVNLLHGSAWRTSELFASGMADRFERTAWRLPLGAGGPHLILDAHAIADCTVGDTVHVGDHTAIFAEVSKVTLLEGTPEPLLYGHRRYARWSDTTETAVVPTGLATIVTVAPDFGAEGATHGVS